MYSGCDDWNADPAGLAALDQCHRLRRFLIDVERARRSVATSRSATSCR